MKKMNLSLLLLLLLSSSAWALSDETPLESIASALDSGNALVMARAHAALDRLDDGAISGLREVLDQPLSIHSRSILAAKLGTILSATLANLDAAVYEFAAARNRARPQSEDSAAVGGEARAERESARRKVEAIEQQLIAAGLHLGSALIHHQDLKGVRSSLVQSVHQRLQRSLHSQMKKRWTSWSDPQQIRPADLRWISALLDPMGESSGTDAVAHRAALLAIRQLESLDHEQILDARRWLLVLGEHGQRALEEWVKQPQSSTIHPASRREWAIRNRLRVPARLDTESTLSLAGWDQFEVSERLEAMIRLRSAYGERSTPTLDHLARRDPHPAVRRRAAELLSLLGDPRGARILLAQRQVSDQKFEQASRDAVLRAASTLRDSGELEEALSLLEDLALRLTADAEVHEALGIVSLRLRDLDRAILELRRAISLEPTNSTTRYNLACALALAGQIEPALTALESAVVAGYSDSQHTRQDRDLESLRGLEQFEVLLERMSQR